MMSFSTFPGNISARAVIAVVFILNVIVAESFAQGSITTDKTIEKSDIQGEWKISGVQMQESGEIVMKDNFEGSLKDECNFNVVYEFKSNDILVIDMEDGDMNLNYQINKENFLVASDPETGKSKSKIPFKTFSSDQMILDLDYMSRDNKYYYVFKKNIK